MLVRRSGIICRQTRNMGPVSQGEASSASCEGGGVADPQLLQDIRERLEMESMDAGASQCLTHLLHRLPTLHFPLLLQELADHKRENW